jgi:cation:H+ antiporter
MLIQSALLVFGILFVVGGAELFVEACVRIAEKLGVPKVIIGLTIVAMGTSAPEVVIGITAAVRDTNALVVGSVVGSNMFNLMFIVGICATIKSMSVKFSEISKEFLLSIVAASMLLAMKIFFVDLIPRWASLIFLIIFFTYTFLLIRKARHAHHEPHEPHDEKKHLPIPLVIFFAILGLAIILTGGHITVESATKIAAALNISERIIGLTVIAIGTSLPELIISLIALKKGESEFALGNIIGSNVFNILFVLGIAGVINPLVIERGMIMDIVFLIAGSILALIFVRTGKRLARREGIIMTLLYLGYIAYVII